MINFNDVINNKVESKRGIVILNFKNGYNVLILCVVNGVIGKYEYNYFVNWEKVY